jgi:hypothetical protein
MIEFLAAARHRANQAGGSAHSTASPWWRTNTTLRWIHANEVLRTVSELIYLGASLLFLRAELRTLRRLHDADTSLGARVIPFPTLKEVQ